MSTPSRPESSSSSREKEHTTMQPLRVQRRFVRPVGTVRWTATVLGATAVAVVAAARSGRRRQLGHRQPPDRHRGHQRGHHRARRGHRVGPVADHPDDGTAPDHDHDRSGPDARSQRHRVDPLRRGGTQRRRLVVRRPGHRDLGPGRRQRAVQPEPQLHLHQLRGRSLRVHQPDHRLRGERHRLRREHRHHPAELPVHLRADHRRWHRLHVQPPGPQPRRSSSAATRRVRS